MHIKFSHIDQSTPNENIYHVHIKFHIWRTITHESIVKENLQEVLYQELRQVCIYEDIYIADLISYRYRTIAYRLLQIYKGRNAREQIIKILFNKYTQFSWVVLQINPSAVRSDNRKLDGDLFLELFLAKLSVHLYTIENF